MARRYLGYGITNSQGIATLEKDPDDNDINGYTGVGAGLVDIIATSGTLQSATYPFTDAMYYESGASDKSSNWNLASVTYTQSNNQVTLNNATGSTKWITLKIDSSTSYLDSYSDYCMEIDLKNVNATDIRLILDNTNVYVQNYVSASDFTHIKIYTDRSQSKVFYEINGTIMNTNMATNNGNVQFRVANGESYTYKEFTLYPI